jgi:hypothetical protein
MNGQTTLYRSSINGGSVPLYTANGAINFSAADTNNIYFTDSHNPGTFDIYQIPATMTGQPMLLRSIQYPEIVPQVVLGSTGSKLILFYYDSSLKQSFFQSIPTNVVSATSNPIRTYADSVVDRFIYTESGNSSSQQDMIVMRLNGIAGSASFVTDVFRDNGANLYAPLQKTFVTRTVSGPLSLIAYSDIQDTNGSYGGGTINDIDMPSGVMTPYHSSDDSLFRIGAGQILVFDGGGTGYCVARMGYPSPYTANDLDNSRTITTLIVDFEAKAVYPMPTLIGNETLHYY